MDNIEALKSFLERPGKIVIIGHHKPDADALGSALAFYNFFIKSGHQVNCIMPNDFPAFLNWMPGSNHVLIYDENDKKQKESKSLIEDAEIIFCVDFSSLDRINELKIFVENASASIVNIDHHRNPVDFAHYVLWDQNASSTAELAFDLMGRLNPEARNDPIIGECIYAGIMTDTGSFRFPSTTPKVHRIIADLIDMGVDNSKIHRLVYDNNSLDKIRFLGFILKDKIVYLEEYNAAYVAISFDELKKYDSKTGDTEGIVNYILSIENVILAALIIERADGVKISFRSVGKFSVEEFARENFNGGGHINAAGGKSNLNLEKTVEKFVKILPRYKEVLNKEIEIEKNLQPC